MQSSRRFRHAARSDAWDLGFPKLFVESWKVQMGQVPELFTALWLGKVFGG